MKYNNELLKCSNLEDLKKLFYQYAKLYHPDHGGSKEDMQKLNNDYEYMFNKVKNMHINSDGATYYKETTEAASYFTNIINKIINIPGLDIDIVGSFIWIGGNTKPYKDVLKNLGFRWSSNKALWYKSPDGYKKASRKKYTYEEITEKYGIQSSIHTGSKKPAYMLY